MMASCTAASLSAASFAGVTVHRNGAFSAARAAPRSLVTRAQQGPKDVAMKTLGALAAAQLALLPLSGEDQGAMHAVHGAAHADTMPTTWSTADLQQPVLFGFFEEKKEELKSNVDKAAATKDDAAERVVPESPGTSQEDNAEKVRQEAENGPTTGGDARAPTN